MKNRGDSTMGHLPQPPGGEHFPSSRWSLIRRIPQAKPEEKRVLLDQLILHYYKPVYRFFQRVLGVHGERLKDVTQDFFTRFVEKDFLKNIHHETSFRNFLKVACRRHYINWLDAERVRKNPGGRAIQPLVDEEGRTIDVPMPEVATSGMIDEELRSDYVQSAIQRLKERLESQGKGVYFQVFEARTKFDAEKPAEYADISKNLGLRIYDVRNHLSAARKLFKEILIELASEGSDDPKSELRDLGLEKYL